MKRTFCDICAVEMKPPAGDDHWSSIVAGEPIAEKDCGAGHRRFTLWLKVQITPGEGQQGVDVCADCVAEAVTGIFDAMRKKPRLRVG